MSITLIEAALEKHLLTIPCIDTAYENKTFEPKTGVPYQRINHLTNTPLDITLERDLTEERGIMQVSLLYPLNQGRVPAKTQAMAIRDAFKPPRILSAGGISIEIRRTPSIAGGMPDGDRYMVPVSIYWNAFIGT